MADAKASTVSVGLLRPGVGLSRPSVPLDAMAEEDLVARASRGQRTAFAELVRRHQGKIRGLLLRLCGDQSLADDLAQEVFLRAYRALVGFEGRARFSTWLYRIGYNVFLNHRTRVKRFAALPQDYEAKVAADDESSPRRSDLRRDLDSAIALLPERYRVAVTLYYLEELSYPEIAEILAVPLGTVKTHLHRAKRMLRAQMHGWGGTSGAEEAAS